MTPELLEASSNLDDCIASFRSASEVFLAAGGDPMELMRRFQQAVMPG